jgi:hypothetical protein
LRGRRRRRRRRRRRKKKKKKKKKKFAPISGACLCSGGFLRRRNVLQLSPRRLLREVN